MLKTFSISLNIVQAFANVVLLVVVGVLLWRTNQDSHARRLIMSEENQAYGLWTREKDPIVAVKEDTQGYAIVISQKRMPIFSIKLKPAGDVAWKLSRPDGDLWDTNGDGLVDERITRANQKIIKREAFVDGEFGVVEEVEGVKTVNGKSIKREGQIWRFDTSDLMPPPSSQPSGKQ